MLRRIGFFALMALAFCTEQNRILVHTGKLDDVTRPDVGDEVEIIHVPTDGYTNQKPGFYTVHDGSDWLFLWKDPRPDAKPPPPPREIDFGKEMLFVAVAQTEGARSIEVKKALETNSGLQIYLTETLTGPGCPLPANTPTPMDIVVMKSVPFDVHVHHDRVRAEECGPPPEAIAMCRVAGAGQQGSAKISAQTGQTIDCDARKSVPKTGSIVDRGWQFSAVAPGSTTKLTVGANGMGVTFALDAWGTYTVDLEVRDQARVGTTVATIDAPAPESGVPIELHWMSFDRNDDASMFPRVELHVAVVGSAEGGTTRTANDKGGDCGPATARTWCDPKSTGTVQQIVLHPEAGKTYRTYVTYQDFRLKASPIACVRTFPKGRPSIATCDDVVRNAGTTWDVGLVDEATTTIYDPKKGKPTPYTTAPPPVTTATATASASAKPSIPPPTSPVEHKNPF